ncbi:MAG: transcriptional regulator [Bacteroidales bacterium]|nr:transcriptional regulator [Bacteroidales bacterium]
MGLPINIQDLIHGNTIEWERLEFKRNWNPEDIMHTICAFANDIHNWGGGYIIVGITEENGRPLLPPSGIQLNQLDNIQSSIVDITSRIQPNYTPITQPYLIDNKHILVLWCPAGDNRPYSAPSTLGKKSQRHHYIRVTSNSIIAKGDNLRRLQDLAARIPFDDRINNEATINDIDLGLIREYLDEIKSDLFEESIGMSIADLCRTMLIAKGPDEDIRPLNIGLLFFSKQPEQFIPRAWIEIVWHKNEDNKEFSEYFFKGPLQKQLRDALSFIKTMIIAEHVIKHSDRAEASRFYNYPYEAIEEALSNAIYHKSYELRSPIEIQIFSDKITILSYPGPVPPVNAKILSTYKHIVAREYRNRRIGDFLKELKLTEGRGTGFPTIYKAMGNNGSPDPIFETDEQTYVLVTLPLHSLVKTHRDQVKGQSNVQDNLLTVNNIEHIDQSRAQIRDQVGDQVRAQVIDRILYTLVLCIEPKTKLEILKNINLTNKSTNFKNNVLPAIEAGLLAMTIPDKPNSSKQKYITTEKGKKMINNMNT